MRVVSLCVYRGSCVVVCVCAYAGTGTAEKSDATGAMKKGAVCVCVYMYMYMCVCVCVCAETCGSTICPISCVQSPLRACTHTHTAYGRHELWGGSD